MKRAGVLFVAYLVMMLVVFAAAGAHAGGDDCTLGPDVLRGIGNFSTWNGNDVEGWQRVSNGNGVQRTGGYRGNYGAGFQTVYGPGFLMADTQLAQARNQLGVRLWAQEPGTVAVRVRDISTQRYLAPNGVWQAMPVDAITQQVLAQGYEYHALVFEAESEQAWLRVELHSNQFGVQRPDGLFDCSPGLCPAAWADALRICPQ